MIWVLDLDGVLWLRDEPIEGSADAVQLLRDADEDVLFVTNNSYSVVADQEAKLRAMGVEAEGAVVTSSMAAAQLVAAGERVIVVGGPGIREAIEGRGALIVDGAPADAVVVGIDPDFSYAKMAVAANAVREGARLIGTNHDPTYPTPEGFLPGGGSIVAAVEAASETRARFAGKPHETAAAFVRQRYGAKGICVGDRADSDGLFATALGYDFGLVLSGATSKQDLPVEPEPAFVADDLLRLVGQVLGP